MPLLLVIGPILLAACSMAIEPTVLQCPDCQELTVTKVIDGDTFDGLSGRVRLYGVDTPERGEPCYRQATNRLRKLARRTVRVEMGPRLLDSGGRFLYYAYTKTGDSIDEILIREGLAEAWRRDGQHRSHLVSLCHPRIGGRGCPGG